MNITQDLEPEQEVIVNDLLTIQKMTAWAIGRLNLIKSNNSDLVLAKSHIEQSLRLIDSALLS